VLSLASAALTRTGCIIWQRTSMGPFSGGGMSTAVDKLVLRKWYLAAWEQLLGDVR